MRTTWDERGQRAVRKPRAQRLRQRLATAAILVFVALAAAAATAAASTNASAAAISAGPGAHPAATWLCPLSGQSTVIALPKETATVTATADNDVTRFAQSCPDAHAVYLGSQSHSSLDNQDEPALLDVWKVAASSSDGATESQAPEDVLLAWERLDDGRPVSDAATWADRMRVLFVSTSQPDEEHRKVPLRFQSSSSPWKRGMRSAWDELIGDQPSLNSKGLEALHVAQTSARLLSLQPTYAVLRMPSLHSLLALSMLLPRDTRISRLVAQPESRLHQRQSRNESHLPAPRYLPPLHALLFSKTLSVEALRADARILTGEDAKGQRSFSLESNWYSRHSATYGARIAAAWIRARMQHDLAGVGGTCSEWAYDSEFAPNVVCTIPPDANKRNSSSDDADSVVLFSSHYDSRGTFGSTRAPGGNDDGSGTTMLLALARHLGTHGVGFAREVRLVAFSGEEQGLVGSQHYARHLHNTSVPIHFQMQTDMIGYRKPGEPLQAAFPDKLATQAATDYVMAIAKIYVPELQLGYTPACCSDHQSFWALGYTSTWLFERRGPIADDRYHDSGDITERAGYDFEQIRANTRLVLATLLDIAGAIAWPY